MRYLMGCFVLCAAFASSLVHAASAQHQLEQCVSGFVASNVAALPDRDELASRALVHCQVYQRAFEQALIRQFVAMDVPPRAHVRELAMVEGVRAALYWANDSVDQVGSSI